MPANGPPRPRRRHTLGWLLVAAAAFLVFELTASPALTVAVGCLKFGWDELATARWVVGHHPERLTGRVLGCWLTAFGLWKTTVVAFVMMFVLIALEDLALGRHRRGARDVSEEFATASTVWLAGCLLSGAMSVRATILAARRGVRVWLGRRRNWAAAILWTSGIFVLVAAAGAACGLQLIVFHGLALPAGHWAAPGLALLRTLSPAVAFVAAYLAPAITFLLLKDRMESRVVASSPEECWNVAWRVQRSPDPRPLAADPFDLPPEAPSWP